MTDRVLLGDRSGTYGLWVSLPGYDVKSCSAEDMIFASDAGHHAVLHQTGVCDRDAAVSFPTLPYVPLVFAHRLAVGGGSYEYNKQSDYPVSGDHYYIVEPRGIVTTSGIQFEADTSLADFDVRYFVLRVPGGA